MVVHCTRNHRWQQQKITYKNNSILILTYPSVKGLEFDTVIIPWLKNDWYTLLNDNQKMKFYVMISRAKKELIFLKENHNVEIIDNIPDVKQLIDFK